ncbi:hypothetical protein CLOSBL3_40021 [Clostridiaceae bacterium BL-3]|nr:hypothetical protein CLOSBL3_40021 [Clostridiaceae bacterium BL-3]
MTIVYFILKNLQNTTNKPTFNYAKNRLVHYGGDRGARTLDLTDVNRTL